MKMFLLTYRNKQGKEIVLQVEGSEVLALVNSLLNGGCIEINIERIG